MPEFYQTGYGRRFFDRQLPELTKALNRVADALEKQNFGRFPEYVEEECKRQWKENQEELYGDWESQSDDTKAEYYNGMYADKLNEINREEI